MYEKLKDYEMTKENIVDENRNLLKPTQKDFDLIEGIEETAAKIEIQNMVHFDDTINKIFKHCS